MSCGIWGPPSGEWRCHEFIMRAACCAAALLAARRNQGIPTAYARQNAAVWMIQVAARRKHGIPTTALRAAVGII